MEVKKFGYEKNGGRVVATVFTVISFACVIAAAVTAVLQFGTLNLFIGILAPVIIGLLAVVALILSLVSIYAEPRLTTLSSVFAGVSQLAVTALCASVMFDGVLFDSLSQPIVSVIFAVTLAALAACWIAFIVLRAQSAANAAKKKGFVCAAIILTVLICAVIGGEIASGIVGQKTLIHFKTYYSQRIEYDEQMRNDGVTVDNTNIASIVWNYNENLEYVECAATYDVSNTYRITANSDDVEFDFNVARERALTYFRQRSLIGANEYVQVIPSSSLPGVYFESELQDKYLMVYEDYTAAYLEYEARLAIKQKVYRTEYKTAREVFEDEFPTINLDKTSAFAIENDPELELEIAMGYALPIARVKTTPRIPNVFAGIAALSGVIALWVLTCRCAIIETVIVKEKTNSTATRTEEELQGIAYENIALNVFLTIITFGIYGCVWFYRNAQNVRRINGEKTNGCGDEVLLSILGGVIYRVYWYYTRAKQIRSTVRRLGCEEYFLSERVYLILSLLSGGLFSLAVMSTEFNNIRAYALGEEEPVSSPDKEQALYLAERRSLLKVVLLGIVTLGVYYIITKVRIANNIKRLQGKQAASTKHLVCMMLVPFYWIIWLVKNRGIYSEGSNKATLEAWLMIAIPMYPIYWLVSRASELREGAGKIGVNIADESAWTAFISAVFPFVSYAIMLVNLNKIADSIDVDKFN